MNEGARRARHFGVTDFEDDLVEFIIIGDPRADILAPPLQMDPGAAHEAALTLMGAVNEAVLKRENKGLLMLLGVPEGNELVEYSTYSHAGDATARLTIRLVNNPAPLNLMCSLSADKAAELARSLFDAATQAQQMGKIS